MSHKILISKVGKCNTVYIRSQLEALSCCFKYTRLLAATLQTVVVILAVTKGVNFTVVKKAMN